MIQVTVPIFFYFDVISKIRPLEPKKTYFWPFSKKKVKMAFFFFLLFLLRPHHEVEKLLSSNNPFGSPCSSTCPIHKGTGSNKRICFTSVSGVTTGIAFDIAAAHRMTDNDNLRGKKLHLHLT